VAAKPTPRQQRPLIEIEDELDHRTSVPPRNPRHILEAADGSDDIINEDPASASENERVETPEESKKAELGT
jgi:hypothetical protein